MWFFLILCRRQANPSSNDLIASNFLLRNTMWSCKVLIVGCMLNVSKITEPNTQTKAGEFPVETFRGRKWKESDKLKSFIKSSSWVPVFITLNKCSSLLFKNFQLVSTEVPPVPGKPHTSFLPFTMDRMGKIKGQMEWEGAGRGVAGIFWLAGQE